MDYMDLLREEDRHLGQNLLPYFAEYDMEGYVTVVDRSEDANQFYARYGTPDLLPVKDISDSVNTFYRVTDRDTRGEDRRDTFAPQYFLTDPEMAPETVEDGEYRIAVEHRGSLAVEATPGYENAARHLAKRWQAERGMLREQCGHPVDHEFERLG